jgi:hypothetical protein
MSRNLSCVQEIKWPYLNRFFWEPESPFGTNLIKPRKFKKSAALEADSPNWDTEWLSDGGTAFVLFSASHVVFSNAHPNFMVRIPTDLIEKFNKKFISKSLKT